MLFVLNIRIGFIPPANYLFLNFLQNFINIQWPYKVESIEDLRKEIEDFASFSLVTFNSSIDAYNIFYELPENEIMFDNIVIPNIFSIVPQNWELYKRYIEDSTYKILKPKKPIKLTFFELESKRHLIREFIKKKGYRL